MVYGCILSHVTRIRGTAPEKAVLVGYFRSKSHCLRNLAKASRKRYAGGVPEEVGDDGRSMRILECFGKREPSERAGYVEVLLSGAPFWISVTRRFCRKGEEPIQIGPCSKLSISSYNYTKRVLPNVPPFASLANHTIHSSQLPECLFPDLRLHRGHGSDRLKERTLSNAPSAALIG